MTNSLSMKRMLSYAAALAAMVLTLTLCGCPGGGGGGGTPETGTGDTTTGGTTQAPAPTVSVKLVRLDGQEMDLGAKPIPLSVSVKAAFSEGMDSQSVEAAASLVDASGNKVPGAFTWNADKTEAIFKPQKKLLPKTTYKIQISTAAISASTSAALAAVEQPFTTMTAGDIDGDGIPDLVVAETGGGVQTGAVYIYSGAGLANNPIVPMATIVGEMPIGVFDQGTQVAIAGDVDADGYADVLIGVPGYDSILINDVGAAFLFSGAKLSGAQPVSKKVSEADAAMFGRQLQSFAFGTSISGGYDVDGDGYDDVIVGEPADIAHPGAVYVFSGKTLSGIKKAADAAYVVTGGKNGDRLGLAISGLRDMDGDGKDDIMTSRIDGSGKAYVFRSKDLSNDTKVTSAAAVISSKGMVMMFGLTLSSTGDFDGDGVDDMIISFNQDPNFKSGAYVFSGKDVPATGTANLDETNSIASFHTFTLPALALVVSGAGDVDGDGRYDIIISEPDKDIGGVNDVGEVTIIGMNVNQQVKTLADLVKAGAPMGYFLGFSASSIGDIDGDGNAEVAISSTSANNGKGAVHIFSCAHFNPPPKYTINGAGANGISLGSSVAGAYR